MDLVYWNIQILQFKIFSQWNVYRYLNAETCPMADDHKLLVKIFIYFDLFILFYLFI